MSQSPKRPIVVYLDQNHWIYLARAAHGHPAGEAFRGALDELRSVCAAERCTLPLSWFHFLETHQSTQPQRRLRLATTMTELSRCATIASLSTLVSQQLSQSIARASGIVRVPQELQVFGIGVSHAFGQRPQSLWESLPLFQEAVLSGDSGRLSAEQRLASMATIAELRRRDVARAELQERARNWAYADGADALRRLHLARSALDFRDDLNRGIQECGGMLRRLDETDKPWLTEVIMGVPELSVRVTLGELRDRQHQRTVQGNDFRDIDALSVAIPHCQIVVTEKLWKALATQAGLDRRFNTRIIANLRELPIILRDQFHLSK